MEKGDVFNKPSFFQGKEYDKITITEELVFKYVNETKEDFLKRIEKNFNSLKDK